MSSDEHEHTSTPPMAAAGEEARVSEVIARAAANGNGRAIDDNESATSALQAALDLVELGYPVFPVFGSRGEACLCGDAACENQGKHPMVKEWREAASATASVVEAWWKKSPSANIGLPCGAESRIVTLDVDHDTGRAALAELERLHGPLPDTVRAHTGGGNDHYLFEHPGEYIKTTVGRPAMDGYAARGLGHFGLDSRADGGYIVAPPSLHLSGQRYRWAPGRALGACALAPLPVWIVELLRRSEPTARPELPAPRVVSIEPYLRAALDKECATIRQTTKGSRNDQLNVSAFNLGLLVAGGELSADVARQSLLSAALSTGLGEREARNTIESAFGGARKKNARRVPEPERRNGHANGKVQSAGSTAAAPVEPAANDAKASRVQLVGPDRIFAPLPPMRWVSRDLMIGPGRPTLVAAYGSSAKTLALQSMLVSLAAGRPIWGHFEAAATRVCHLDYEQGYRDTCYRYQRLAIGHGIKVAEIGDRLQVGAMPSVYLTSDSALDDLKRLAQSFDLVLIDSLRAAAPGVDENASEVRQYIDLLTRISDATGCAFIVIHHAGKGGEGRDARQLARGSSAIFDACGCVLNIHSGKSPEEPRTVSMSKPPASSEGAPIEAFGLVVQDVAIDGNPIAGVSVSWRLKSPTDADEEAARLYERDAERLIATIRANPGASSNTLRAKSGIRRNRVLEMLSALTDEGRLTIFKGPNRTKNYRVAEEGS